MRDLKKKQKKTQPVLLLNRERIASSVSKRRTAITMLGCQSNSNCVNPQRIYNDREYKDN